jgi:hypothetical protein
MITLELQSEQEAQVLVNLLNIAVQAKGLEAAEAGVYFTKKIKEAVDKTKAPAPELTKVES